MQATEEDREEYWESLREVGRRRRASNEARMERYRLAYIAFREGQITRDEYDLHLLNPSWYRWRITPYVEEATND